MPVDRYETIRAPAKAKTGSVLVVGGGIGGIQASLDLVASGFKVYLVDSSSAIGGVMARLDKTFPTNDCSMCILAPKLVECGRDPNIELLTISNVAGVRGRPGDFEVTVVRHPRFIDPEKCTGCGDCSKNCPVRAVNEFNEGLDKRTGVYVRYPQAVPRSFLIDKDKCIGCGLCENICLAKAISFDDKEKRETVRVGSIVLVPGFEGFDPRVKSELGYGEFPNVITSIEFERILSASGPYQGHILRPSDGAIPKKVAWIQCVGSRDQRIGNDYCSSVCCTYATKEAIIAREHVADIEPTIFLMDMRAIGKGFERYYERASTEYGVRYVRSRVSHIEEDPKTGNLSIKYEDEGGSLQDEEFDLVVLSVGLGPPKDAAELAEAVGIDLNKHGFADTIYLTPLETSRPGVFCAGAFQGPQDIPDTVVQASGASSLASTLLKDVRGTKIKEKSYPKEMEVVGEAPRIGAFICHCGINIGGVVDVPQVVEYAKNLAGVVYAEHNLYTCSDDTQKAITEKIRENKLNRVVVASCTPRTHEPLFQETLRNAGLNPYLFEMTNIREQDSWAHQREPEAATEKAKDLVRMAVAKAKLLEPLEPMRVEVIPKALVIGGGVAGMISALEIARKGFETHLIEKEGELGGHLRRLYYVSEVGDIQAYLNSLRNQIASEPLIKVHLNSCVEKIEGFVGNFKTTLTKAESAKPKAASPPGPSPETEDTRDKPQHTEEIEHGVIVAATGAEEYKPTEYYYGKDPRVVTQTELERLIVDEEIDWKTVERVVMIQCVGSRNEEHPYCSKFCCAQAVKNTNMVLGQKPSAQVFVLYRDMRTYSFREQYYNAARDRGALFIRYDDESPPVVRRKGKELLAEVFDPMLKEKLLIPVDLLVLSAGVVPASSNQELSKLLKVPLNEDGFFLEAHVKLRPVDFATEGIYLAGLAHAPKTLDETIAQALAASSHASIPLSQGYVSVEPIVSQVDEEKCIGCGLCVFVCSQNAIELSLKEGGRKAEVVSASCKGCGTCGASCPQQAITMRHFTNDGILAQVRALAAAG